MKDIVVAIESMYELGQRANQEDFIYPSLGCALCKDTLFIVCDGMGGHESGEVASATVCGAMSGFLSSQLHGEEFSEELFKGALSAAYDALDQKDSGAQKKMGTTMTLLKLHPAGAFMAHIGDSRIYHIRPATREILYKSRDHSLVNDLYDIGEITLEQMKTSSQRNIITRVMQPHQKYRSKAEIHAASDVRVGDYFLLCTDGVLESLEDDNLVNILSMDVSHHEKMNILHQLTQNNKDNHSAYLVYVQGC
ncbi:MAG: protein phosphatase 2C domain-containing protein [Rikenellaceae bacterium]